MTNKFQGKEATSIKRKVSYLLDSTSHMKNMQILGEGHFTPGFKFRQENTHCSLSFSKVEEFSLVGRG